MKKPQPTYPPIQRLSTISLQSYAVSKLGSLGGKALKCTRNSVQELIQQPKQDWVVSVAEILLMLPSGGWELAQGALSAHVNAQVPDSNLMESEGMTDGVGLSEAQDLGWCRKAIVWLKFWTKWTLQLTLVTECLKSPRSTFDWVFSSGVQWSQLLMLWLACTISSM